MSTLRGSLERITKTTLLLCCCLNALTSASYAAVTTVDDLTYKKEIEESTTPVFIDFYADWCGPCKKVSPILEELSTEYSGKIKFVKVDVDKAPKTAEKFAVDPLPTMTLRSKKVGRGVTLTGFHTKEELKDFIEESLKKI